MFGSLITVGVSYFLNVDSEYSYVDFQDGEVEMVGEMSVTHRFIEVSETLKMQKTNVTFHILEAGDPSKV